MTIELKPYPAYRASTMPWLLQVPEHWDVDRAKWLFRKMDRPVRETDEVVTCFRDGTVTLRKNRRDRGFTESLKEIGYQGIRRGDLVIHGMDAFAGAVGVSDSEGKGTPVYSVCKPAPSVNAHYFTQVVREMARSEWILALAKGVRERSTDFRFDDFASQLVPLPPLDEQDSIVQFIDHVDRRVRRYVAARRKLIRLLNEERQAFIRQSVTRGLDPRVELARSGVDWLGDIPRHWNLRRLRFLAHINTGGRDTVDRKDNGEYPFFVRSQVVERIDTYAFDGEAVLTAGDGAGVAKVFHYINGKFDYHQRVYSFNRFRAGLDGRFFFYYLSANLRFEAFRETAKSTVDSLRRPLLANLPVVVPPILEQKHIVSAMDSEAGRIEAILRSTRDEIEMVREYRTRLVGDVVAGKVDVREAVARLGDEVEEPELFDDADVRSEDAGPEVEEHPDADLDEVTA